MKKLKLQGYVTPADCGGDVQKAVDLACELGINKVVVRGDCQGNAVLPSGMYFVVENGVFTGNIRTAQEENYSFRTKYITIEGLGGTIRGNVDVFNTHHVNVSGLTLEGELTFEYCLWGRVEQVKCVSGGLRVGRGCGNFILQDLESEVPAYISGAVSCGKIIPGSKPDVNNIILCDSRFAGDGVYLDAAEDCGVMNIQVDHVAAAGTAVTVGSGRELPAEQFFNLTFTDLTAPKTIEYRNETKHVYVNN